MLQCLIRRSSRTHHILQKHRFAYRNNHLFCPIGVSFANSVLSCHSLQHGDFFLVKEQLVVATSAAVSNVDSNKAQIASFLSFFYAKIKQYLLTWYRFLRQSIVFTPVTVCAPIAWLQCQNNQNINWFWDLLRNSIYVSGYLSIH